MHFSCIPPDFSDLRITNDPGPRDVPYVVPMLILILNADWGMQSEGMTHSRLQQDRYGWLLWVVAMGGCYGWLLWVVADWGMQSCPMQS